VVSQIRKKGMMAIDKWAGCDGFGYLFCLCAGDFCACGLDGIPCGGCEDCRESDIDEDVEAE
jgi:hypothetical protein